MTERSKGFYLYSWYKLDEENFFIIFDKMNVLHYPKLLQFRVYKNSEQFALDFHLTLQDEQKVKIEVFGHLKMRKDCCE